MSESKHLSALKVSKGALATPAQKDALKAAGMPFDELTTKAQVTAMFSAGKDGPATAKQLALLSYLGTPVSENISKKEAADCIDAIVGDNRDKYKDWNDDKLLVFPDLYADEIAGVKKACFSTYNAFRAGLGRRFPKLPLEGANRIFAYLDANRPGWTKPREGMFLDHFLPCVEAKIHLQSDPSVHSSRSIG